MNHLKPVVHPVARRALAALDSWVAELVASLPPTLAAWLLDRRQSLTLTIDTAGTKVRDAGGLVLAHLAADAAWPSSLAACISEPISIELPRSGVLIRTVTLPLGAAQELHAALAFEIDRKTPFSADQVWHAGRAITLDAANGTLRVELAVAPRRVAEAALVQAERWGLTVAALRVAGDTGVPAFNLLPVGHHRRVGSWRSEPWKQLCLATLLLLVAGLAGISWRADANARALQEKVAVRREAGKHAETIKAQADAAVRQNAFIAAKRGDPPVVAVVADLSELLPDDSYLTTLTLAGRNLRIEGMTDSVPALIKALEQGKRFAEVRAATAPQEKANGKDRFDLTLILRQRSP